MSSVENQDPLLSSSREDHPILYAKPAIGSEERAKPEGALPESQKRFRDLFDYSPLSILEVDLLSKPSLILRANRRAEEVFGCSALRLCAWSVEQIMMPESVALLGHMIEALRTEKQVTVETMNQRNDGSTFPVRIHATAEDHNDLSRVIWMVEDLTLEKGRRSEEQAIAEERRRIAQEIHDGLIQNLAGLRFRIRRWHKLVDAAPAGMHQELELMQQILDECIVDTRRSIMALRPSVLENQGFYSSLQQFLSYFSEQYDLQVRLEVLGPKEKLPSEVELTLFRVAQEGLNNIWKHAHATHVWATLDLSEAGQIVLSIRDDGIGMDEATLEDAYHAGHLGLKQMRERLEEVKGRLSIHSQAGWGTDLRVVVSC
jgi:PAS domain S-box-containing protein